MLPVAEFVLLYAELVYVIFQNLSHVRRIIARGSGSLEFAGDVTKDAMDVSSDSNSIINPFIYAAKYREFQHGVRRLLSMMRFTQQLPQSQVSAIT